MRHWKRPALGSPRTWCCQTIAPPTATCHGGAKRPSDDRSPSTLLALCSRVGRLWAFRSWRGRLLGRAAAAQAT
eukprot:13212255-Alexandrium_andersonii.AAC.1